VATAVTTQGRAVAAENPLSPINGNRQPKSPAQLRPFAAARSRAHGLANEDSVLPLLRLVLLVSTA
jgi:hypothetical protein